MTRWGHTHSAATGMVGGLLLVSNGWLVLAALLLAGLVGWWAHALRHKIGSTVQTGTALIRERVKTERARRRNQLEAARDRRAERDKRENASYWRGVRDGTP